jgi:hypothetical protein
MTGTIHLNRACIVEMHRTKIVYAAEISGKGSRAHAQADLMHSWEIIAAAIRRKFNMLPADLLGMRISHCGEQLLFDRRIKV